MSKKAWIIFASVCILLLAGLIYQSSRDKVDVSSVNVNATQKASAQSGDIADHIYGKKDSKVTLVEYGDYQCPGCADAFADIKTVTEKYEGQLAFVFRQFPLTSIHPNAKAAAAATEAAGLQGKFWEMHNKVHSTQSDWKDLDASERSGFFAGYARDLGLNVGVFTGDMASAKITKKINYDFALGKKSGVSATPSLFLNGKAIKQDTWSSLSKLDQAIADELKSNGIELPKEDE